MPPTDFYVNLAVESFGHHLLFGTGRRGLQRVSSSFMRMLGGGAVVDLLKWWMKNTDAAICIGSGLAL